MKTLLLTAFLVITFPMFCEATDKAEALIAYDPEFWKEPLRLSNQQMISIRAINSDFYESVSEMASDNQNTSSPDTVEKLNQLLNDRSDRIWNVLSKRQKARWTRIIEEGYAYHSAPWKFI